MKFRTAFSIGFGLTMGYKLASGLCKGYRNALEYLIGVAVNEAEKGDQSAIDFCEALHIRYRKKPLNVVKNRVGFEY